ncbi:MAG: sterol desaturase family protein [Albidovulum sp.]
MPAFEALLRLNGETWLYAIFFGSLAVFAFLETRIAMCESGAFRGRRWPVNAALTVLNIAILGAVPVTALMIADFARDQGLGLVNLLDVPMLISLPGAILLFSLQSWAVHYAMHRVPVLWRLHRVHHTDTHMDISTTVRFHPAEFLLQLPVSAALILASGAPPAAAILYELADAAINVFSHSNIRLPSVVDRILSRLIVTPHLHRIHHSPRPRETDSNFGATLPVWDMIFGTYRVKTPDALARQAIGLDEMQDARAYSLWWALTLPFRNIQRGKDAENQP